MFDIVKLFGEASNQWINVSLLILACIRIYLEVIEFKFYELPVTKGMFATSEQAIKFHRTGFYFSVGYVVLFAPAVLLS